MGRAQEKSEGYNGWKNYETWNVALWIDNDQGTYSYRGELVDRAKEEAKEQEDEHAEEGCEYDCGQAECPYLRHASGLLADSLKEWVEADLIPDLGASLAADLLGAAVSEVDWREIAENFLSE